MEDSNANTVGYTGANLHMGQVVTITHKSCVCVCVLQHHSRINHRSPETMHLYVYIKRKCLSFL